jgi:purine-binding chemotaxis protein CheW
MEQIHILTFRLDQQAFAFPIDSVFQIIDMVAILPLPQAESLLEGVINLHGRMVPIINLHRLVYDTPCPVGLHTPILLVKIEDQTTGLIVDEVLDVNSIPANQIAKPADFLPTGIRSIPILKGLTTAAKETVIVLELDHLLDVDQAKTLRHMLSLLQNFYKQTEAVASSEKIYE